MEFLCSQPLRVWPRAQREFHWLHELSRVDAPPVLHDERLSHDLVDHSHVQHLPPHGMSVAPLKRRRGREQDWRARAERCE